jgi:hypothetical protein
MEGSKFKQMVTIRMLLSGTPYSVLNKIKLFVAMFNVCYAVFFAPMRIVINWYVPKNKFIDMA